MTANEDMERFKLVIAGDGACGKTSLLTVFKVRYIQSKNKCEIFNFFAQKLLKLQDDQNKKFQVMKKQIKKNYE